MRTLGLLCIIVMMACGSKDSAPRRTRSSRATEFSLGDQGAPETVGCADGQREGFGNAQTFPDIAGCAGAWVKASLRAPKVGSTACGDDLDAEACPAPANLCAPGWHICMDDGDRTDLTERIEAADCPAAGNGLFLAASSHTEFAEVPCRPILLSSTFDCREGGIGAEAICCGNLCRRGRCADAVWLGETPIGGRNLSCANPTSRSDTGVLCCRDRANN